ncbi:MAG: class I SAM-dependent methyltransferase [Candidatus Izemoplasmatales bacterium]|nr:class I SAM-dependent methyltransferase [bacterium]MDZ4197521.1 class I SAM-dependent methyltransferase [Candidatus Izemoplasmatales bacterium]
MNLVAHNKEAWDNQVKSKNKWTLPVDSATIELAKRGEVRLLLTPTIPTPMEWINPIRGKKVLCLASGGGQQGPLFAAMGADVTVFDNSPEQLKQDEFVMKREGLSISLVQGDMRDLSHFESETFDLIFHPVSNVFVDQVNIVWKEAYRVLKKGGVLLSGCANPILFIFDFDLWDKTKEMKVSYKIPYSDIDQLPSEQLAEKIKKLEPLEFGHSLDQLIGGQIAAGFAITGFYEDHSGWGDLLDPYIPSFFASRAVK